MVETIQDPREERMHLEEDPFLAKLVELGIAVEEASRNELVENSHHKGWEDGEENVVEG